MRFRELRTWLLLPLAWACLAPLELAADILNFQEGVKGYAATQDTSVHGGAPKTSFGAALTVLVDSSDLIQDNLGPVLGLIKFEKIIGTASSQIPPGSKINAVALTLRSTAPDATTDDLISVHRMLRSWSEDSTWDSLGSALKPDDQQALRTPDASFAPVDKVPFEIVLRDDALRATVQTWVDGKTPNEGWLLMPHGPDGYRFNSSEDTALAAHPSLAVDFTPPVSNKPPTISNIPEATIDEDKITTKLGFVITDSETPAANLGLSAVSGDTTLVPNANIVFSGNDTNRAVTVIPAANQSGKATITVTVSDGNGGTASDSFVVTVNPVNDPPTVSNIADQTISEDAATGPLTFSVTDVETPASDLVISATTSNPALVPVANIVFGGTPAAPTVTVTPLANGFGFSDITVKVTDANQGTASDTFRVTVIAVNDPPTISNITDQTINEDGTTGALSFTASDAETAAASLSISVTSSNPALIPVNNVVFGGTPAARTVTVTPVANASGSSDIRITVTDANEATASDTFTVTVMAVNDPPAISNIADQTISEDGTTGPLSFTASDAETAAAGLTLSATSSNPDLIPVANIVFGGTPAARTVTVTPVANGFGSSDIRVTVTDGNQATASDSFKVTVNPVNDPPKISDIANQTINEDGTTGALSFTATDAETAGSALAVSVTSSNPALVPLKNIVFGGTPDARTVTITPVANGFGSSEIRITVTDANEATASDTFTLTVNPVNDPPTLSKIADQNIPENGTTGPLAFTATDVESPASALILSARSSDTTVVPGANIVFGGTPEARTVTITPAKNVSGTSQIRITAVDPNEGVANQTFLVTVSLENQPPTISNIADQTISEDGTTGPLTFTAADRETPDTELVLVADSSNPTLIPVNNIVFGGDAKTRTVTVTPVANGFGSSEIRVVVTDGSKLSASDTFVVTVTPLNDPPTISDIPDQTIDEDGTIGPLPFQASDTETASSKLTFSATSSNPALVPVNSITFGGTVEGRTVTVKPVVNGFGTADIRVIVTDGENATASDKFVVTVKSINDLPAISNIADQTINEDGTTGPISFSATDAETPGSGLTLAATSTDTKIVPVSNIVFGGTPEARTVTVTPAANAFGSTEIKITVTDGDKATASDSFLVTVNSINDPPVISKITGQKIDEGGTTGPLAFTATDVETPASALKLSAASTNTKLVPVNNIVLGGTPTARTVTATSVAGQVGTATISIIVLDANEATATSSFDLTVSGVAPKITKQPENQTVAIGEKASLSVVAIGSAPLSYQWFHAEKKMDGATGSSLNFTAIRLSDEGEYNVVVSNPFGAVTSTTVVVVVSGCDSGGPKIVIQPASQTVNGCGSASFNVTATGLPSLQYQWLLNGNPIAGANGPSYTKSPVGLQDNGGKYSVVVTDKCGNTKSETATLTVTADTAPPQIVSVVPDCSSNKVTITFNEPIDPKTAEIPANYQITTAGVAPLVIDKVVLLPDGRTVCIFLSKNTPLKEGVVYTLIVKNIRDACGSTLEIAQQTFICQPKDCIRIQCPENLVVECKSPKGTPVDYIVLATNVCSPKDIVLKCDPPPKSLFPPGVTKVECVAIGNNQTVRCSFTVTVVDRIPPEIRCPGDMVVEATSTQGTQVFYTVSATDNCDPNPTVTCTPPSGSNFPLGPTTVTCVAVDRNQNTSRCTFVVTVVPQSCDRSNKGTDFWLTFPGNYPDPINPLELSLCIVGHSGISGTVAIADPPFSTPFAIPAGAMSTTVTLPTSAGLGDLNDAMLKNGIHVTSTEPVAVFGFSHVSHSTESYLGLPSGLLGNEYIVMNYGNLQTGVKELNGTQFALVACSDNTQVQITVPAETGGHAAGVPFTITLNSGQTYQLRNTGDAPVDLTGTIIHSDKPVAAFGSHVCANIPNKDTWFCDYLVEQLLPTSMAGSTFITMPVKTRNGDTFRMLALNNGTTVSIDGVPLPVLNRAQFHERELTVASRITANAPIFVAQYAHSSDADEIINADPFMVMLPHIGLFSREHMVCVRGGDFTQNYINVVIPTAATGSVQIDGAATGAAFIAIGASGFSGAQIPIIPGGHNVTASAPFGTIVYGFAEFDSYCHPGSFHMGDSNPPTLTCGTNRITIPLTASTTGNCVALLPDLRGQAKASDDCATGKPLTITQDPPPGTPIGVGDHTVTLHVQNSAGTASCEVIVTVVDGPLAISCPENIVVRCKPGASTTIVNYNVSAHTPCQQNFPVECNPPSGSPFPMGVTPVTCRATGPDGKTVTCTFVVRVVCTPNVTVTPTTVNLTFATDIGLVYVLDFKSSLNDSEWTPVRTIEGHGSDASFTENLRQSTKGFYRLRIQ